MKKLRITPLNIIVALAVVYLIISFFQKDINRGHVDFTNLYRLILGGVIVVSLITDTIFRFVFKEIKRIWFVELFFISLTVILFLILQK